MILFLWVLVMGVAIAETPKEWAGALELIERHEFYPEKSVIDAPKNSWQTLFALTYLTRDLKKQKDCIFYRVPGDAAGILKIKQVPLNVNCSKMIFEAGDREIPEVRSLEFHTYPEGATLTFTLPEYRLEIWEIQLPSHAKKGPELLQSSAEYKSSPILMLAPTLALDKVPAPTPTEGLCHDVDDLCQERSPSRCHECAEGWYEIPNGCFQGPKYCGRDRCGEKGMPACRRGMKYQKQEKKFECRTDPSFVYCSPGLMVQCEGALAYCR